jgi:hypothetical protein
MKILATLAVLLSFQVSQPTALPHPQAVQSSPAHVPHGKWYLAESGHAVYCYGPVKVVNDPLNGMQRVATFCKGDKAIVPLKD